ncbi:MAG TPA: hypothetical protein VHC22_24465 [Pirellulales bacterium]|nr:hypothetical protein [Pirellulales bacterium]
MPRPQFTLRALLVAMLVVAAFFAGAAWQRISSQKEQDRLLLQIKFWEDYNEPTARYIERLQRIIRKERAESGKSKGQPTVGDLMDTLDGRQSDSTPESPEDSAADAGGRASATPDPSPH